MAHGCHIDARGASQFTQYPDHHAHLVDAAAPSGRLSPTLRLSSCALAEACRDSFHPGILLCTGGERLAFGARTHALPMSAVWSLGTKER